MTEYVSGIEKLKVAKELQFPTDQAFGRYEGLFAKGSVAHPAKMSTRLTEYLVTHYTKEGETIVDPFGGVGTTAVVGALNNRNVVLNELEPRFVNFINETKKNVEGQTLDFSPHGSITVHQGDSRKLSEILSGADSVILSPPYAETLKGSGADAARKRIAEGKYHGLRPDVWISKGNIAGNCYLFGSSPKKLSVLPIGSLGGIVNEITVPQK